MTAKNDEISELKVLKNGSGMFYIGRTITYTTADGTKSTFPYSRESREYWTESSKAELALENNNYTLKTTP